MKILLAEDDEVLISTLTRRLDGQHYIVDTVKDGEAAWNYATTFDYDAIVAAILLPKLDGISLCQKLRSQGETIPAILLADRHSSNVKVRALNAGADDYLVKPFELDELIARLRALRRRSSGNLMPLLAKGGLMLDLASSQASYNGKTLTLTTKEYDLLELFLQDTHQVFSINEIIDRLWSSDTFPAEATVRSHLRRLRHKLTEVGAPKDIIGTIHGRGYYLKLPSPPRSPESIPLAPHPQFVAIERVPKIHLDRTLLIVIDSDRPFTSAIESIAWQRQLPIVVLPKIEAAIDYLYTQPPPPTQIFSPIVILIKVSHKAEEISRSVRNLIKKFPSINIFAIGDRDSQIDRLSLLARGGKFLGNSQLSADRIIDRIIHYLHRATVTVRVMFVDEDLNWLRQLPNLLAPWQIEVTTLADPHQFWLVFKAIAPQAVILSAHLLEVDSIELCQLVRNDIDERQLPILLLGRERNLRLEQQGFTAGIDDFLYQPIDPWELASRIHHRIGRSSGS
jgi:DNA-binding response OmpR family regulator